MPLPIIDYVTDLKSVLDQISRVLNAMIETTKELAFDPNPMSRLGEVAKELILISQMICQVTLQISCQRFFTDRQLV
jgi:hypothetical protein